MLVFNTNSYVASEWVSIFVNRIRFNNLTLEINKLPMKLQPMSHLTQIIEQEHTVYWKDTGSFEFAL